MNTAAINDMTPLYHFFWCFPPSSQLIDLIDLTNNEPTNWSWIKQTAVKCWNSPVLSCWWQSWVYLQGKLVWHHHDYTNLHLTLVAPECHRTGLMRSLGQWGGVINLWLLETPNCLSNTEMEVCRQLCHQFNDLQASKLLQSFQLHLCWKLHEPALIRTGMPFDQSWPPSIWSNWLQARERVWNSECYVRLKWSSVAP